MGRAKLGLAVIVACCAGCAVLDPQAASMAAADDAVGTALYAARAPRSEQDAALERAKALFGRDPSPANRLRIATLLAVLPPPLGDEARALDLLAPIADAYSPGVGRMAALLAAQLTEQQRLARNAQKLARDSERSAREREREDQERDKREEALRQQVEALRTIERNIEQREERLRGRQR